jgi:hypothetical protein
MDHHLQTPLHDLVRTLEDQLLLQRWLQDPVLLVLLDAVSQSVLLAQLLVLEVLVLVSEVDSQAHLEALEPPLASLVVAVLLAGHVRCS